MRSPSTNRSGGSSVPTVTPDPWSVDRLDLDGYLARIGVPARPPSRAALDELHEAHVRTFTFDYLDVALDQHAGVELDAVQAKFVGRGRGGYCFEHATIFAAALARIGYDVERRLGRVDSSPDPARTHCVVAVAVDGRVLLGDPGFGMSLLRPIELVDGATDDYGGWRYRVGEVRRGDVRAWELQRWRDGGWMLMHTHDELPVTPVDLRVGHHYTSTYPHSHFRHGLAVTRHIDGAHVSITHHTLTSRRPGQPTEHCEIDGREALDQILGLGVPLTDDEQRRLLRRIEELRTESSP